MRRRPTSYAWALHVSLEEEDRLTESQREGLEYARQLAEDAQTRKDQVLHREARLPALTIEDVADGSSLPAQTIRRRITSARHALYGQLTDNGIYYRKRRERQLDSRPPRPCQEPDCPNRLPQHASAARQYCDQHHTNTAAVRRHRQARTHSCPS